EETIEGKKRLLIDGREIFRDEGQLRMTTVRVSPAGDPPDSAYLSLGELMATWFDDDDAVYPYSSVHQEGETAESSREEGAVQMATSQDDAVYVALTENGIDVPQVLQVAAITAGGGSEGILKVGDVLRSINGEQIADDVALREAIQRAEPGEPIAVGIERADKTRTVEVTPIEETIEGKKRLLIGVTPGYDYDFPFEVKINISDNIGGPSAGLIFSLAVYDTITPGSLTGGARVAGTGEIAPDGTVGPIGGIQQKIAGARAEGTDLFLVPAGNCADALGAENGDMTLVRASTMHEVRLALEAYAADPTADLPSCEDVT
ncbi:PDZ domain-containing protein, partial [Nocardioides sp.]|uniref:YlbL family protein n=1 Tax=Nocardioides sp. TaxID=35761 RepID=UPI002B26CC43